MPRSWRGRGGGWAQVGLTDALYQYYFQSFITVRGLKSLTNVLSSQCGALLSYSAFWPAFKAATIA